jgi:hypothetical protein
MKIGKTKTWNYAPASHICVIGAIFIFFAIASEASVSSVFSVAEKKCSFRFSLDLQESQIGVVIAVGILLVPFSLSSVLVLIHNKHIRIRIVSLLFVVKESRVFSLGDPH